MDFIYGNSSEFFNNFIICYKKGGAVDCAIYTELATVLVFSATINEFSYLLQYGQPLKQTEPIRVIWTQLYFYTLYKSKCLQYYYERTLMLQTLTKHKMHYQICCSFTVCLKRRNTSASAIYTEVVTLLVVSTTTKNGITAVV